MAARVPTRLTAAAGRKFGVTVGLAFAASSVIVWWRGGPTASTVGFVLGGTLLFCGLAVPTRLGPVERTWMRVAHFVSLVTTPIFMGLLYFVVIAPIGFIRRRSGSPLAAKRPGTATDWEAH